MLPFAALVLKNELARDLHDPGITRIGGDNRSVANDRTTRISHKSGDAAGDTGEGKSHTCQQEKHNANPPASNSAHQKPLEADPDRDLRT